MREGILWEDPDLSPEQSLACDIGWEMMKQTRTSAEVWLWLGDQGWIPAWHVHAARVHHDSGPAISVKAHRHDAATILHPSFSLN